MRGGIVLGLAIAGGIAIGFGLGLTGGGGGIFAVPLLVYDLSLPPRGAVVETPIHADYVSGTREMADRVRAKLYLSDEGSADWKYHFASQDDHCLCKDGVIPGYIEAFTKNFGGEDPVSIENTTKAIAAFERTLITPGSCYDCYAAGETSALTEQEARGIQLFEQVGCASCHAASLFGGDFYEFPSIVEDSLVK